jgi:hypothetical protein
LITKSPESSFVPSEKLFPEYVKNVLSVVLELEPKYLAT